MKKKEAFRLFNFSDAVLITKAQEKISFMRRDYDDFEAYGILNPHITALETSVTDFSNSITDIEALSDKMNITSNKNAKAEELRVAIRAVMSRVQLKYGVHTATYRKFGTDTLSLQTDSDLLITGKRVVRVGHELMSELTENGLTEQMLTAIDGLIHDFEMLIIDMKIKIGERDILQENRVETANAIYETLVAYTKAGQSIWSSRNVAKYNDYVLYNTISGEMEENVIPLI
jgi:hypothetical protein